MSEKRREGQLETLCGEGRGTLYLVPVPIGNLEDITLRALRLLRTATLIACEDTRRTRQLLRLLELEPPALISLHEHNESQRLEKIVARLEMGESVVLVSDAGTPSISDPGFPLVRAVIAAGLPVSALPGPCALIPALAASGLASDRFAFYGFPPSKAGARARFYQALAQREETLIFYESPHRLQASLEDAAAAFGETRRAVIAREISKRFESFERGALAALVKAPGVIRGEVALLIEGAPPQRLEGAAFEAAIEAAVAAGESPSRAAKTIAKLSGQKRSEVYQRLLEAAGQANSKP
ncbi:MAG: 16S rRNA (cytidine(1402)-2'-O)-methyltransferase [Myxococcota bacterium]|nr:16S rRNA (cytidine(1402)-2'-O)-methyltransferase [Myxococcota bacterium]